MVKKKYRDITVDGVDYAWSIQEKRWPHTNLRIWRKSRGKVPWCDLEFMSVEEIMKPRNVSKIIVCLTNNPDANSHLKKAHTTFVSTVNNVLEA